VPQSMIDLASGCDVLIHMCHFATGMEPSAAYRQASGSHMDIAEVASRANVKTVVLSHCIPLLDAPGVMESLVSEMRSVYAGNIVVGRDLMEIPLQIRMPHRID
jgi:ribonuclease Z